MKKVLSDLELLIDEKDAIVTVRCLPVIKGYRRQLQQLFHNLIGNALKYSKPGIRSEVLISSRVVNGADSGLQVLEEDASKQYNLLEISDNGIGFYQHYADRIFVMFQRLHNQKEYSGTGIGLSLARKVVENHDGYIWAESRAGEGATFKVLLPVG